MDKLLYRTMRFISNILITYGIYYAASSESVGWGNVVVCYTLLTFMGACFIGWNEAARKEFQNTWANKHHAEYLDYLFLNTINYINLFLFAYFGWWVSVVLWVFICGNTQNALSSLYREE